MNFIIGWILNGLALWLTALLGVGIGFSPMTFGTVAIAALIFGLLNALVRPLMVALTLPINVLTLGLFTLIINGIILWLLSLLYGPFVISGFWWAVLAALVLTIISTILGWVFGNAGARSNP